jgi:type IV pilus assembly protein PilY1
MIRRAVAVLFATAGGVAFSGTIAFPPTPLNSTSQPPPNVTLALSVEFPTVGAAYNGANAGLTNDEDRYYASNQEYLGYWDPNKCYDYSVSTPTAVNEGYFRPVGAVVSAATRACNTTGTGLSAARWSGNFLNWAMTSAIDVLRKNLSGGYRVVDTASLTVLARAKLDGNILGSRNYYFPTRRVGNNVGSNVDARLIAQSAGSNTRHITVYAEDEYVVVKDFQGDGTTQVGSTRYFNPRVKVCDGSVGSLSVATSLESNCTKYGSNYKPEGNIQKYSGSMRFAAFGYLIDNTNSRQGGVMRAAMKSTGPQRWASGAYSSNPNAEWSSTTGVFLTNPDGASEGNSGVANYLNKFGLVSGYKGYDPVGELYSESVRYLMGKAPVPSYVSGITNGMKDGFPAYTSWPVDPVVGACQKNHIITIGDNNTWCDGSVPGGSEIDTDTCGATSSVPADFNATAWTNAIGALEPSVPNMSGARSGAPGGSYLWAGIAYYANTQNLRPDLSTTQKTTAKTYTIDVGEPSIPVNQRSYWFAAKYGGFDDASSGPNADGKPNAGEWEANPTDPNSYPRNFFLASDPVRLNSGLNTIFSTISTSTGGTGRASTSSSRVTTGTGVFSLLSDTSSWTGDVQRYPISVVRNAGATSLVVGTTPAWTLTAAEQLNGQTAVPVRAPTPLPADRNIVTMGPSTGKVFSDTDTELVDFFKLNPATTPLAADLLGPNRIRYIRGARTDEAPATNNFRPRKSLLGDPGRSGAVYVGAPSSGVADPSYGAFARTWATRSAMLYVGMNDGMLHGFNAATGAEVFAYLPRPLWSIARDSTNPSFARTPTFDAIPVSADVKNTAGDWSTIITGGFGAGAKGLYALKVTDPTALGASSVLWEFTPENISSSDAADLGHITGQPKVTRLPDGKWALIVGNGYNSDNSRSVVFVVLIDRAGLTTWSQGTNYWKLGGGSIPASIATAPANGMAPVGLASANGKGTLEYAYAGDLLGNVYRFDFTGGAPPNWPTNGRLIFSAGTTRPITTAPKAAFHSSGGFQVLVGTGRLLSQSDKTAPYNEQSMFGLWDNLGGAADFPILSTDLANHSIITSGAQRTISGAEPPYGLGSTDKRGWKLPLPSSGGERVVADPDLEFGKLSFTTVSVGAATCEDGASWLFNVDPETGLVPPRSFDTNGDGKIDATDALVAAVRLSETTFGSPTNIRIPPLPGSPLAETLYFTILPTSVSSTSPSGITGKLNTATGPRGRINFRQITR